MTGRLRQQGFTLVELLVAVMLIATVLSLVYGSYIATTRSAQTCKSRIALARKGRKAIEQIARHVRCSYVGSVPDVAEHARTGASQPEVGSEIAVSYFSGDARAGDGEILRLVTTSGFTEDKGAANGLFEVVYKFDERTGELALSPARFVGALRETKKRDWRVVADQIESVDLAFFNGEKWLKRWNFEDEKGLPRAVRIEIGGENERFQRYEYGTVAYVSCRDYRPAVQTKTLVSVDRK
ncbi:MAG: type II secretion system protein GspJ [Planctomycetota bacterium]|jgi:prepilin-type N-terminal cleavage/methylation domain-containing protein